ncbi:MULTISPECIES: DEAD/DEAH box helicase [Arthrobacter]|uniref:DEAD/DEAH box helicase n=1 Tax=Arthrobacter terricola TaxID=2547396 RepID=A0A4R5K949_9MICC|nr:MULTISPECIES: DEAD/DEAH box helicase [Arthrobacter]MBT8162925.1 DEAD/DEAH box helicase [Arthrobacter sp. GN70]TDF91663.1 DEAD/DEAH box helicase [Arthrobacter terricola]
MTTPVTPAPPTAPPVVPAQAARTLMPHQQQAVDFMVSHPYAGIWLAIGGGKTASTLTALQQIRPIGHILVIAPVAIARSTWLDEIEDLNLPIRTRSLIVDERDRKLSKKQRLERIRQVFTDPPTMYFINQDLISRSPDKRCRVCRGDGLKNHACIECQTGLVDQMPRKRLPGPDGKLHDTIIWPFQTVIIDESQEFKSHSSNRFKALARVRPAVTRFIELTGTPSPNGLEDLWSQMYLLDQGQALGATITAFRKRWFTPKMIPGTTTPAQWLPNTGAEQEIHQAIAHLVMSARNTSLVLPPLTVEDIHVRLTADLMAAYREFKKNLVIDIVNEAARRSAEQAFRRWIVADPDPEAQAIRDRLGTLAGEDLRKTYEQCKQARIGGFVQDPDAQLVSTVVAENQAVLTSKLMQFASGTLYTSDPDDPSTKGRYEVLHDEKIHMAEYLVRNNGGDPVLIAYHFKSDREQLMLKLNRAGIRTEAFDGSRAMTQRWSNKQIPVMLIHPASAGAGLNLQHGGSTMIWYTLPFSLKHYQQTNGRLFRTGQTKPVRIYQLITKDTQDERMPAVLQTKDLTQTRLIQAVDVEKALASALEEEIRGDVNDLWSTTRL